MSNEDYAYGFEAGRESMREELRQELIALTKDEPDRKALSAFQVGFMKELKKHAKKRTMTAEGAGLRAMLLYMLEEVKS